MVEMATVQNTQSSRILATAADIQPGYRHLQSTRYLLKLLARAVEWYGHSSFTIEQNEHPDKCPRDLSRHARDIMVAIEVLVLNHRVLRVIPTEVLPFSTHLVSLTCGLRGDEIYTFLHFPSDILNVLEQAALKFIPKITGAKSPRSRLLSCLGFTVFKSHRALREATLEIQNEIHPLDLKLPFAQLTKLDFSASPLSPTLFLRLMRATASSLLSASFQVRFPRISNRALRPMMFPVSMPQLTDLRLVVVNSSCEPSFFFLLHLPVLQSLRIEKFDQFAGWEVLMYEPLLVQSFRTLRILELVNYEGEVDEGYVPPVRKRERTSYQELNTILAFLSRLEVLRLAVDIEVHADTIIRIAKGQLAPLLSDIQLYSANGELVMWMVERRKFLEGYCLLQPGSSKRVGEQGGGVIRPGKSPWGLVARAPSSSSSSHQPEIDELADDDPYFTEWEVTLEARHVDAGNGSDEDVRYAEEIEMSKL
ncbi:hypothetical protein NLJ89_g638 [Agrocybe chaxingu]|uniref:Uncharacterized protein n=1 Tax=Agrocybe chaxingu TaxID=84603 RepID=A0A9W8N1K7_9AGAR|nr:hypothetical protein NLJ89_g638 [Agrocybe chaxingu]